MGLWVRAAKAALEAQQAVHQQQRLWGHRRFRWFMMTTAITRQVPASAAAASMHWMRS